MFALVDANNFYVSCISVFRPSLRGHAVVCASNNDGCAIARSNEAKALGIKMGQPLFEIRQLFPNDGVIYLSTNFTLVGDMSNRMMSIAAGLGPTQEIYSVDESFVGMHGVRGDLVKRGRDVRARILQWVGLPCGIGFGTTKTLAKLANHVAKQAERKPGSYPSEFGQVCNLAALPASDFDAVLTATALQDIWGVGPRIGAQLRAEGLVSALDVARMDPATIRRRWSVVLERTVRELQGQSCISLEDVPVAKKQIVCSNSFGSPVTKLQELIEATSSYAARASLKLRHQNSHAGQVTVFIHTSPFRTQDRQYSNSITVPLRSPTSDIAAITAAAVCGAKAIYRPGYNYAKAGVMLLDLQTSNVVQGELDLDAGLSERNDLMIAMDSLNSKYGRNTVSLASSGVGHKSGSRAWAMRQEMLTTKYTTRWDDIPIALA